MRGGQLFLVICLLGFNKKSLESPKRKKKEKDFHSEAEIPEFYVFFFFGNSGFGLFVVQKSIVTVSLMLFSMKNKFICHLTIQRFEGGHYQQTV